MTIETDNNGRVVGYAIDAAAGIVFPEGFSPENMTDWTYKNGVFEYDPVAKPVDDASEFGMDEVIETLADMEYRICLMEMGVDLDDL